MPLKGRSKGQIFREVKFFSILWIAQTGEKFLSSHDFVDVFP